MIACHLKSQWIPLKILRFVQFRLKSLKQFLMFLRFLEVVGNNIDDVVLSFKNSLRLETLVVSKATLLGLWATQWTEVRNEFTRSLNWAATHVHLPIIVATPLEPKARHLSIYTLHSFYFFLLLFKCRSNMLITSNHILLVGMCMNAFVKVEGINSTKHTINKHTNFNSILEWQRHFQWQVTIIITSVLMRLL